MPCESLYVGSDTSLRPGSARGCGRQGARASLVMSSLTLLGLFPHLQNGNDDSICLPGACDNHMIKMENTSRLVPAQSSKGLSLYYEDDY